MQVKITQKNVSPTELAKALTGVIQQQGISHEVIERLHKAETHGEPIPEKYIAYIYDKLRGQFRSLMATLDRNVDLWLKHKSKPMKKSFLRKADDKRPPMLSQEEIDELRNLIEAHFRKAIGIGYSVPEAAQKQWKKAGIKLHDEDFESWIRKAYVGGRLAEVLSSSSSYTEMMRAARKLSLSRMDKLVIEAAKQNAARYIKGYGAKLADLAEDAVLSQNKSMINDVVQKYFAGELKHTTYNGDGLAPQEVEALKTTDRSASGWRELSTELKNRFKAADVGRDWDRVAQTETRYATNLGRLVNIQVEGGGNSDDIEVYFHVGPGACDSCRKMYLESDGSARIFKLSEILNNVQETGGMQIGLKASLIGQEGGWVPNATCHPFGHCYPQRVIKGYKLIPTGDVRT